MALTKLLTRQSNYLGTVLLDVVITETSNSTIRVTKNPVENGADINDHIIIEPMTYSMQGVVSDSFSSSLASIGNLGGVTQLFQDETKSQAAWEELLALQRSGEPFTLVQNLRSYENVVITNLTQSQDKDTSNALIFNANLTELILVGTGAPPTTTFADEDTSDKATPATDGGLKSL